MATVSLCLHVAFSLFLDIPGFCSTSSHIGLGPHPYNSMELIISLKARSPNPVIMGVKALTYASGGGTQFSMQQYI